MKQLTLRQIPEEIERELRQTASRNETSLNQTAIVNLQAGLGLTPPSRREVSRRGTRPQAGHCEGHLPEPATTG